MGCIDKKFSTEYINNFWDENIEQKVLSMRNLRKNILLLHLCMHIVLLTISIYAFKNYTLPSLGIENDLFFYTLALIPNFVLGYYTRNVFINYRLQLQNTYISLLNNFNIKNTFGDNILINLKNIKAGIPGFFNTAYIENTFSGKYDDISFELAILRLEKISCSGKSKFYNKTVGSILVLNDFLNLKYSASVSQNLEIKARNYEDEEKIKNFMNCDYFGNFNNIMNLNGILFSDGKIFIFLRHANNYRLPTDIKNITKISYSEFFNTLFKDLSIIDELLISQRYENSIKEFIYPEVSVAKLFFKYLKVVLLYIIFLMVTFYMITILTITIMLSFIHQYWSFVLWIISPIISIIAAFFLTKNSVK